MQSSSSPFSLRIFSTGLVVCAILTTCVVEAQTRKTTGASQAQPEDWLAGSRLSHETVTEALNRIAGLSAPEAVRKAEEYRGARTSEEGRHAGDLLAAAALEQAGDFDRAHAAYQDLIGKAKETPYASSAAYRVRVVEQRDRPEEEKEKLYKSISEEPESEGWFLASNQWTWDTTRRAACRALMDLRGDHLSIKLFSFLRSKSTFPTDYAYLFVLLALGIGVKVLALPLQFRAAELSLQMRKLSPEIESIKAAWGHDAVAMQQRLAELYKARGLNFWGGCAVTLVDLIFVIWVLVTLRDFAPQMTLDGAKLFWVPDVLKSQTSVLYGFLGISVIQGIITASLQPAQGSQLFWGSLFSSGVFMVIAWYWQWPAYVIIFWGLLSILGILTLAILLPIKAALMK